MPSASANGPLSRLGVLLPLAVPGPFDYCLAPSDPVPAPGDFVAVPFRGRTEAGVVWGPGDADLPEAKLKPLLGRLDCPPLSAENRRFIEWVAAYTLSSPGAVLKLAMSEPSALAPEAGEILYRASGVKPPRLTPARARVLEAAAGASRRLGDLAALANVGPGVIRGLAAAGALAAVAAPRAAAALPAPDADLPALPLSDVQAMAAAELRRMVAAADFAVALLEGVAGAGKTEVYFEAIAEALRRGRQILVLLPEIALSAQWFERFRRRFGAAPALWHSEVKKAARRQTWRAVAEGRAKVVVGARSALFLPYADLGLIVVDEEHDASYKQEEGVIYNARDMAVARGSLGRFPVVLASATPSIESLSNAARGRYRHLHLPNRHGAARLPEIVAVDLRRDPPPRGRWLAPKLRAEVAAALARREQVLLFLNRRGYAPLTLCGACGHRLQCPNCSAWLVDHQRLGRVQCHHCGHAVAKPETCPHCGAEGRWRACGPGVERVAEEAAADFPEARLAVLTSDTLSGPAEATAQLRAIEAREIDLLVGTQLVAKGHHFPHLTLVGVVDADLGLNGGDLRAGERTLQLLTQVAGRAGREQLPGRVLVQTHMPEHPVMRALLAGDTAKFLEAEIADRRAAGMPPYGRLVALIVSGPDPAAVKAAALALGRAAPSPEGVHVFGPAPAPLARLRGRYRERLLLTARPGIPVQALVRDWCAAVRLPRSVRLQIDVDPYSFL